MSLTAEYRCAACLGTQGAFFGAREGYTYVRCNACGTLQLDPLPSAEFLARQYAEVYSQARHCDNDPDLRDRIARPYYDAIIDGVEAHGTGGRVLDYGAGWGGMMRRLLDRGHAAEGVEPSDEMFAHCQSRGLSVLHGDISHPELHGPFDALVMSAVFEHLVGHEAWLKRAASLLRPGGLFVSMQPTAPFGTFFGTALRLGIRSITLPQLHQTFCPPWHTVLFSLRGMDAIMARHGFTLVDVRRGPQALGPGLTGVAQRAMEYTNRVGWALMGKHWPGVICHIFVYRKNT